MMRLSLSGRVIEVEYRTCELGIPGFLRMARDCGYDAVELRATQFPPGTAQPEAEQCRQLADQLGLSVSCCIPPGVTADEAGLQQLEQFVVIARSLECDALKVWVGDADWLRRACDRVAPHGVTLLAQTHTGGPFETIDSCLETLARVGRENLGLQYDPANLMEAEEEYGAAAVRRLGPAIRQLSVQSLRLARSHEPDVWEHAGRHYRRCRLVEPGALDYADVFQGLRAIGFDGYVTVNEPRSTLMPAAAFVKRMWDDLRAML